MTDIPVNPADRARPWLLVGSLPLLALLGFSQLGVNAPLLIGLVVGIAVFALTVWTYYALARVALMGEYRPIAIASLAALVVTGALNGWTGMWQVATGIATIVGGACVLGYLTGRGYRSRSIYIGGAIAVALLFTLQFGPIWGPLIDSAGTASTSALEELKRMMVTFGYSDQQITDNSLAMKRMFEFVIGLMPALTVLSSMLQFTLGFFLFAWWADRKRPELGLAVHFDRWRVPFKFTPLLILAIAAHALGNETLVLIGRNILAIMAVYYGVAGLSMVEYYLKKLQLSLGMKILFYLLLFFTQMVGFAMAAILGFLDSFFDWRTRTELREQMEG